MNFLNTSTRANENTSTRTHEDRSLPDTSTRRHKNVSTLAREMIFRCEFVWSFPEKNDFLFQLDTRWTNSSMFVFAFRFNLPDSGWSCQVSPCLHFTLCYSKIDDTTVATSWFSLWMFFLGDWTPAIWFLLRLVVAWSHALLHAHSWGLQQKFWLSEFDLSFTCRYFCTIVFRDSSEDLLWC